MRLLFLLLVLLLAACSPTAAPAPSSTTSAPATGTALPRATVLAQAQATAIAEAAVTNAALPTRIAPTSTSAPTPTFAPTARPTEQIVVVVVPPTPPAIKAPSLPAVRSFTAAVTGAEGLRFTLYCERFEPDGSTSSQSWFGVVPSNYAIGDAIVVSCVASKQIARTLPLALRIMSAGQVFGESETTAPYGVAQVSTRLN